MFKKFLFQIHWFLGISAGLILSIMGVTGAIYSYDQQILKWVNTDSYVVQVQSSPKLTPAQLYQHFTTIQPEIKINSITIAKDPTASSVVNIEKEGERRGYNMMVNPYTAQVLPEVQGRKLLLLIQQIHRNLTAGEFGKQITGACALMLIYFVLSGLYLRWPKKHSARQWLAVKPKLKGRNFIWDLHAVVGTWVIVFYLLFACTGLYWSYDWWRSGMFKVLGVEQPKMQGHGGSGRNKDQLPKIQLDNAQLITALNQTWSGFNNQIGRDYSTLTVNLPKKDDGKIELSFVDATPQHERARNQAVYNYKTANIEKMELYEDKKLNQKIMSSMLPVHRGSFFGPVYQFVAMLASLAMPLFFITGWMLYLKRRKQKKLTQAARQSLAGHYIDQNAKPWLITYATQTGVAEQLAWSTATSLQEAHQPVQVKSVQQLTEADLQQHEQILFVISTYGTGEAPDLASNFAKKLLKTNLRLQHVKYAVLALGSKEYPDTYCSFGHTVDEWLKNNGAKALFDIIEVDNANPADIQNWNQALVKATKLDLHAVNIEKVFDNWILQQRDLLNPNSLGQPAYNIELTANHEAIWQAGDIAEIQPGNSPERINKFLQHHHILKNAVVDSLQVSIEKALWNKDLTGEIEPFANLDHLLEQLPTLPTREYSIASIPSQQVLRLVVRQQYDESGDLGLGSGWLTQHTEINQNVALRIRTNESFHLIDDNRPIICIGNGTGIAGLMSLLHTRTRHNYTENWLIFGERQRAHDFFYASTIEAWQTMGMLKRLDLAFSRDQEQRVYVQDIIRQNAAELVNWIERGAVLYVCGSIEGMASGVDQALIHILGEEQVDELRQQGRYRRDVY
ncbi:TPA: sulfite reductase flavoprotein subunit alpha [Acinetobacter baumannii]|uniref:sulfite reductase flavoprotein subunit alpha n=1 Tax=Acinetobacter TaxID=469 RepID=UPI0022F0A3D4|nr:MULTISPECIES: sulfite reductase flavoprotein subunit alpha [Acinetobacter]MCZ2993057.1 sulfite reductase flavoprotein subunit alpha [Acinetobacter baumannii]MCZ3208475.1 sulfite reductase flavoprotein subunit alpha [Acinetobacter baumannii]MCZ3295694.1 sulfite reductase flavoprotein subunit alpha [Acinetobacter baumannii]MDA4884123.1 sulfite reductase flavoprotein subunit alpha [Acinetobacter baumannii]MDQ9905544.1 sulfite reductase flavoprotein subunit alpha [Acinetobacter sp. 148]